MKKKVFHGDLIPRDLALALTTAFTRENLVVSTYGGGKRLTVQVSSRPNARSGGQTSLTIYIERVYDGVHVQIGKQAAMGIAASLGQTALAALRNPFSLINRLDDVAQDIENLQLDDDVWEVITQAAQAAGASHEISEKLKRLTCEYCEAANPVGVASCLTCGAPLGESQPRACLNCGYIITGEETICPNCHKEI